MTLIKVKDENGEEAFLGTKEEFEQAYTDVVEVYVCVETKAGKADKFFRTVEDAKEFLSTYE